MRLSFTPLELSHLATLSAWLGNPHVRRWWPEPSELGAVTARYRPIIDGSDSTKGFVIVADGVAIGYIQCYRLADEPRWSETIAAAIEVRDAAGIDYFIGDEASTGLGLGSAAIKEFVSMLWGRCEEITAVVVAVQQANLRSWRALERAGFRRVWAGLLETDDPSDQGPAFLYVIER